MLIILVLLLVALWPLRRGTEVSAIPAKCFWTSLHAPQHQIHIGEDWIILVGMLTFAYLWKLSQLFVTSKEWVRRWLIAKPEATMERLLRRTALSHRSRWLTWPVSRILTICYIAFVAYAEFAESFVATIIYLCLAFTYGLGLIITHRINPLTENVVAVERRLTFGQLVPLFLLMLPILLIFELSAGKSATLLVYDPH